MSLEKNGEYVWLNTDKLSLILLFRGRAASDALNTLLILNTRGNVEHLDLMPNLYSQDPPET